MKVLLVASECSPIVKVGGLADVVGSLPRALKNFRINVSVLLPFYEVIKLRKKSLKLVLPNIPVKFENKKRGFNLWKTFLPKSKVPVFLIEEKTFGNGVYVEADASAGGSKKECERFLFLSLAAIETAKILKFDILHCHDWHTAIIPFLIKRKKIPIKTLLTIHNLGYQGKYRAKVVNQILETNFTGEVNFLKQGILNADFINTVSENYAKEILTPEYGSGLENSLQKRKNNLMGILNGLGVKKFNPKTDDCLKKNYSIDNLNNKKENKIYLQKKYFKKTNPGIPILGIVSRLAEQKGIDLIEKIFPQLIKENLQFILLGKGIKAYEDFFKEESKKLPGKFFAKIGFDERLAHQIYAGSDIFLMPSRYEPCGLGQLISMRYGTIPVARATGGLKDTILPISNSQFLISNVKGTGFLFEKYNDREFLEVIKKALNLYKNKKIWKKIQENGMKQDFSWNKSAKKYLKIYKKLMSG